MDDNQINDQNTQIEHLRQKLRDFREERGWTNEDPKDMALSLVLESMYQRNLKYPDLTGGKTTTTAETKTYAGAWSPSTETFDYTIESVTATSYKLKAKGNDRNANCEMTLDNKNERKFEKTSGCGGLTSW